MRNKFSLRKFAIFVALVAVILIIGLYGTTNRSKTDGGNGAISLEAPLFISVAEAAETGITAFPADKAGISAYVKLPTTIDLDKVRTIFTKVEDVGDNYIIGIVLIPNHNDYTAQYTNTTKVHLYADIDGWLVAYLTREEPAARIMKWPVNYNNTPITKITTTTLREALRNAGQAAGVGLPPAIKYYDFRYPDANLMTLFVKVQKNESKIVQMKIPADWVLYDASYYISYGSFRLDGTSLGAGISTGSSGSYQGALTVGTLHTIEPDAAIVTVLIYKTD